MIYITHYHSYNTKFRRPTLSNVYVGFDQNEMCQLITCPFFSSNFHVQKYRNTFLEFINEPLHQNVSEEVNFEDNCLLGCCAMYSVRNLPTFQRCLLPPSSGHVSTSETSFVFYGTTSRDIPDLVSCSRLWTLHSLPNLKVSLRPSCTKSFKLLSHIHI
jgi:hypothetical protein